MTAVDVPLPGSGRGGAWLRPGLVSPVFNGYKRDPRFQGVPYGQQFPVAGGAVWLGLAAYLVFMGCAQRRLDARLRQMEILHD